MNTKTMSQFEIMDTEMLACVEGGLEIAGTLEIEGTLNRMS